MVAKWSFSLIILVNFTLFKLGQLLTNNKQRTNYKLRYQIKEKKFFEISYFLVFLRIKKKIMTFHYN